MTNHLSASITAIRRSPYQALAAILILTITFFVGYVFSLFLYGSEQTLRYFETRPQITAFFNLDTTPDQIQTLEKTMRDKSYVDTVTVISKEKALEIYRQDNQKDPLLLELVTADILPASIEVSGKDVTSLATIKQDLEKATGVDEVVYQQDVIESLQKWTQSLRYIGVASVAILGITSFLIIVIVTGMKVAVKRRAIHIMGILGATKWYVKAPFVFEGIIYGLAGSLLGWSSMYIGVLYLTPWLKGFLGTVPLLPLPLEFLILQIGIGTLIGIILGSFASSVAVQRMMRRA
jgi:cell division transport system permease protein